MWRVKSLDAVLAGAERKSLHRSLGPVQLTMLGIGGVIGTGIFVLTSEAAQKAGPGMMLSFVIAGAVSAVAALCYAEMAAMVPVSGSAYTYSYTVLGELVAWLVGWALVLEYAVAASAVSVGWSGYIVGLLAHLPHPIVIPPALAAGPYAGGVVNLLAVFIALVITTLLVIGTRESATVNAVLVAIKLVALGTFIWLVFAGDTTSQQFPSLPAQWLGRRRRDRRGFVDLLRLCGVRFGFNSSRGNQKSATQPAHWPDCHACDLHHYLSSGGGGRDRFPGRLQPRATASHGETAGVRRWPRASAVPAPPSPASLWPVPMRLSRMSCAPSTIRW